MKKLYRKLKGKHFHSHPLQTKSNKKHLKRIHNIFYCTCDTVPKKINDDEYSVKDTQIYQDEYKNRMNM